MSIQETLTKIKRVVRAPENRLKLMIFSGIISHSLLIVLGFSLGYIFHAKLITFPEIQIHYPLLIQPIVEKKLLQSQEMAVSTSPKNSDERNDLYLFIAAKKGTVYYPKNCPSINRIKKENIVYFKSKEEAESSGYTKSKTCLAY